MDSKVISREAISSRLKEYIKGQDDYIEYLATVAYKFILMRDYGLDSRLKETALITGPTGTGKTYGLKCLSKVIDVPLYIADASTFTKAGYTGNTVSKYIIERLKEAEGKGAIFVFDEIDKMMDNSVNGFSNDAYFELLKVIEDSSVTFGNTTMDLDNVFIMLSGSFGKLREKQGGIYAVDKSRIEIEDFRKFGLPSELLGRISRIIELRPLGIDDLRDIIRNGKDNYIDMLEKFLLGSNIAMIWDRDRFADYIMNRFQADSSCSIDFGARDINRLMMECVNEIIEHISSSCCLTCDSNGSLAIVPRDITSDIDGTDVMLKVDFSEDLSEMRVGFDSQVRFCAYDIDLGSELMMRMILSDLYLSLMSEYGLIQPAVSELFHIEDGKIPGSAEDLRYPESDHGCSDTKARETACLIEMNNKSLLDEVLASMDPGRDPSGASINDIMTENVWRIESGRFRLADSPYDNVSFCLACLEYLELYVKGIRIETENDGHLQDTGDLISTMERYPLFRYISELRECDVKGIGSYISDVFDFMQEISLQRYDENAIREYLFGIMKSVRYLRNLS